jgi:hypothetical protein
MGKFPTSRENIVLDIIFELMGESRINRSNDEYMEIASRLPPLKVLQHDVNERLRKMAANRITPYQICHFSRASCRKVTCSLYTYCVPALWISNRSRALHVWGKRISAAIKVSFV